MRIKDARPVHMEPTPRGFRTIARFNLEPAEGVLIYDCIITLAPNGRTFVYGPPSKRDAPVLSLAPDARRKVISMTLDAIGFDKHEHASAA